jgi:transcription antitermination factor NusG
LRVRIARCWGVLNRIQVSHVTQTAELCNGSPATPRVTRRTTGERVINETQWYAVMSRSRHERMVAATLASMGIRTLLPLVAEVHHWSDRRKVVDVPLFPGYVFVQIPTSREAQVNVLRTAGVVRFVGNQYGAVPIPDKEIDDVRAVLSHKANCSPYPFLQIGQRVRIVGGSLDGVEGILLKRDSERKLVISIQLIQRSLAISVCNFDVEPVANSTGLVDRPFQASGNSFGTA